MASGMVVLPRRERQMPEQQAMQGLCPSLQAELPGGNVVLSALSFPLFQKVRELGFKMDEETACGGFSVQGQYDFLCGAVGRFYIRKTPDFHLL